MKTFVALSCIVLFAAGWLDAADAPLLKLRPGAVHGCANSRFVLGAARGDQSHGFDSGRSRNAREIGNLRNLDLAAAKAKSGFTGPVFMDSDVHKADRGGLLLAGDHPDPALAKRIDEIIAKLAAAQLEDGYLDSYYVVKEPGRRWTNLATTMSCTAPGT